MLSDLAPLAMQKSICYEINNDWKDVFKLEYNDPHKYATKLCGFLVLRELTRLEYNIGNSPVSYSPVILNGNSPASNSLETKFWFFSVSS